MEYQRINKKAIKAWLIGRIIFDIIFIPIYYLIVHRLIINNFVHTAWIEYGLKGLSTIIIGYLLVNTFILPGVEYKEWRYEILKDKITLEYGIFIRSKVIIPISRIQYLDITQGPIYRKLGLTCLTINTAAGDHEIPALTMEESTQISENLKEVIEMSGRDE